MEKKNRLIPVLAGLCALAAAALAVLGITTAFGKLHAEPVLLTPPHEAEAQVAALMDAACAGDYDTVSSLMVGHPGLTADREPADPVGELVWDAFVDSLSYELEGDCHATDRGLAQNVRLTGFDLPALTEHLREASLSLLEERIRQTEDQDIVYDDRGDYREAFVLEVLQESAEKIMKDAEPMTQVFTLHLLCLEGQWLVVPDEAFLNALSGGVLY